MDNKKYEMSTNGEINIKYDEHMKILNAMSYCYEFLENTLEEQLIKYINHLNNEYLEYYRNKLNIDLQEELDWEEFLKSDRYKELEHDE